MQLDRVSQMALIAGREAWAQSDPHPEPTRAGAILAASLGLETLDGGARAIYAENVNRLSPLSVARAMPSAPASQCAMAFGLQGPTFSIGSACASANHSIGLAASMIRSGMADVMVAGGADASMTFGGLKSWDALHVLSPNIGSPFAKDHRGLVLGEGGAILVLEDWDRAGARGATIHAEILGFGMTADARDPVAPDHAGALASSRDQHSQDHEQDRHLEDDRLPPRHVAVRCSGQHREQRNDDRTNQVDEPRRRISDLLQPPGK